MNRVEKRQWQFSLAYLLIAAAFFYLIHTSLATPRPREVSYTDFLGEVRAGRLAEVTVSQTTLLGLLKEDAA